MIDFFKRFCHMERGEVSISNAILIAVIATVVSGSAYILGKAIVSLFDDVTSNLPFGASQGVQWDPDPDFVLSPRRLPRVNDGGSLWAVPLHSTSLPDDIGQIGGQPFTLIGDGNPRLLIQGADPRVISGPDNPQYDVSNYANSGVAYGTGSFHRILVDTPAPGQSLDVQLHVGDKTIQYRFYNQPY